MPIKYFEEFTSQCPQIDWDEQAGMLSDFTTESLDLLIDAKNAILALETVPNDLQALNHVFKVFYTIKGLSGFLGLGDIQRLAKDAEDLFDLWRKGLLSFDAKLIDAALDAVDTARKLLDLLNEQILQKGNLTSAYLDITPVLQHIYNVKRTMQISDAQPRAKKQKKSLPISEEDSRSKIMKRQQELIHERELAIRLSQQAQREAAEKSEMLASMSHEMRTLINAILGFSELLIKSPLEDRQKEFLASIRSSGTLLLEIINNILDLAKVERGKIKFEKVGFHLEGLVEDVFRIMRTRLENKPIMMYFDIAQNIPFGLKGDPTRLRQILINLIGNAVKFTQKGEVGLRVELSQPVTDRQAHLVFKVSDTGVGIPKSRQNFIFEAFTQGDKAISREYGGTGLGLTISRGYIQAMGGKIWVESEVGKGSHFLFSMEFERDESAGHREITPLSAKALDGKTALIIDKDPRNALERICQQYHLSATKAEGSVKEIYEQLRQQSAKTSTVPDIIFIDILTSRDDAYLLANKVHNDPLFKTTQLIAVTADIRFSVLSEAYKECFHDFLLRPITQEEFLRTLERTLRLPRVSQGVSQPQDDSMRCDGINVLIVDDSLTNIELIKAFFESIGCIGDYAHNGQEAIEMIKEKKYDVCFMDLQMPVMNGYAAAQIIRQEISKDLPIVALTAADISEDKDRCMQIGFNDFLMKPFDMADFQGKIIEYGRKI